MYRNRSCIGILVVLCLWAIAGPAAAEPKLALVIGNSQYAHAPALSNPVNDAALIGARLSSVGFTLTSYTDLSQKALRRAVSDFAGKVRDAGSGALVVFYFAGHGLQINGANYLVPIDARIESESDIAIESVSVSDVVSALEHAGGDVLVMILDACRNNPFASASRSMARGLARLSAPTNTVVAYSTAPGTVAADGDGRYSPYSQSLAEVLEKPGLTIEQVFKQVRIKVHLATGGKQTPWEEMSLIKEVTFHGGIATPPDLAPPEPTPPVAAADACGSDIAYHRAVEANTMDAYEEFVGRCPSHPKTVVVKQLIANMADGSLWDRTRQLDTQPAYQQYLVAFPSGNFAELARIRLSELEPSPPPSQPQPQVDLLQIRDSFDAYGPDFQTLKDVDFATCHSSCSSMPQCMAFTYNKQFSWCFLKQRPMKLVPNNEAVSGLRSSLLATTEISNLHITANADMPGGDYRKFGPVVYDACFEACDRDPSCRSFAYVSRQKICWLKSGLGATVRRKGIVLGVKH